MFNAEINLRKSKWNKIETNTPLADDASHFFTAKNFF